MTMRLAVSATSLFCTAIATQTTPPVYDVGPSAKCIMDGTCESSANNGNSAELNNQSNETNARESFAEEKQFVWTPNTSILDVLNPDILKNEDVLRQVQERLENHQLVILRDAFRIEFADYVWEELYRDDLEWEENVEIDYSGFSHAHSNFYFNESWTPRMFETHSVFDHPDTRSWIANLTGRVTTGTPHYAAPSRFFVGDYSMPHDDYAQERTVSYVWHLSKDWNPSWGGAFYWTGEQESRNAYVHASYNTLVMFSVTRKSQHMVTLVTSELEEPTYKRLAWNGWWLDGNEYDYTHPVEEMFDTPDKRLKMTAQQVAALLEDHEIQEQVEDPERALKLREWRDTLESETSGGPPSSSYTVDLNGSLEKDKERWEMQWEEYEQEEEYEHEEEYDVNERVDYWRSAGAEEES